MADDRYSEVFLVQIVGVLGPSMSPHVACLECGATVNRMNLALHDAFHDKLRKQACRT